MCGIAGFWRLNGPRDGDCDRLARMSRLLVHRGPDDHGYLFANSMTGRHCLTQAEEPDFAPDVFLASRRLAITDLSSAGRQPLCNTSGSISVVFNGAIHNYVELRDQLQARGHDFQTLSDTEVLLRAYEEWGPACATHFNGMWAYVIWDRQRRRLVCSRDRFGIKPLYTARIGDTFYFASEAKAIAAIETGAREPNFSRIRHLLDTWTPQEGRHTPFARIGQLPAAHNLVLTRDGDSLDRYWRYDDQSETYDYANPAATFHELFSSAVDLRLRGDVPAALLLSGGLDSSTVAAVGSRRAPGELRAFTARFSGFQDDESHFASVAASHAGVRLDFVDYRAESFLTDLQEVTWHMDAPVTKGQMLARWFLIEEASRHATILLEGQGADEFLGGYPDRYFFAYLRSEIRQGGWSDWLSRVLRVVSASVTSDNRSVVLETMRNSMRPGQKPGIELLSGDLLALSSDGSRDDTVDDTLFDDSLTQALYRDHSRLILPHLLHFGDAISMAHGAESRLPFLDHRLVEFVFGLGYLDKISGSKSKVVLREAFSNELPEPILARRKKVGFATPLETWLGSHFHREIKPLLLSTRLRDRQLFNEPGLLALIAEFEATGKRSWQVFRCLCVELWFQQFVDGDGLSADKI